VARAQAVRGLARRTDAGYDRTGPGAGDPERSGAGGNVRGAAHVESAANGHPGGARRWRGPLFDEAVFAARAVVAGGARGGYALSGARAGAPAPPVDPQAVV